MLRPSLMTVLMLSLICCSGCMFSRSANPATEHPDLAVTPEQIRMRLRGMVEPLSGIIVAAANQIIATTDDQQIQRAARLWKVNGPAIMTQSLYRPRIGLAVYDSWILSWQMHDYFKSGPGHTALGNQADIAIQACITLEQELRKMVTSFSKSGEIDKVADNIRAFATRHPINTSIPARVSISAQSHEFDLSFDLGIGDAMHRTMVAMDDMTRMMNTYAVHMPNMTRWQAELLVHDLARAHQLDRAIPLAEASLQTADKATLVMTDAVAMGKRLETHLEKVLKTLASTPDLLQRERTAVIKSASQELTRTLEHFSAERVMIMKQLDRERNAVQTAIADERKEVLTHLSKERREVINKLVDERHQTIKSLHQILANERSELVREIDERGAKRLDQLFDRAFTTLIILLALGFVGAIVLILLIRFLWRPSSAAPAA